MNVYLDCHITRPVAVLIAFIKFCSTNFPSLVIYVKSLLTSQLGAHIHFHEVIGPKDGNKSAHIEIKEGLEITCQAIAKYLFKKEQIFVHYKAF